MLRWLKLLSVIGLGYNIQTMNQTFKRFLGTLIVLIPVFVVIVLWLLTEPLSARIYDTTTILLSVGRLTALVGLALYSLSLILHIRITLLKKFLDGAHICHLHHDLGSIAFVLLLIHPLALAVRYMQNDPYYAAKFLLPYDNLVNLAGFVSLVIMIAAMVVTYYYKKNHTLWLWIHRAMLVAYVGAFLHLIYVTSDTSVNPVLKYYMIFLMSLGVIAFIYQRISRYFPNRKVTEVCE